MNDFIAIKTQVHSELVSTLLLPLTAAAPAGEDISYSVLFDDIREARRADDADLAQGEWQTKIKTAEWPLVRSLCENALRSQTKDMQIAAWYTEALIHSEGFAGLSAGLELISGLLSQYWYVCFPALDGNDASERAAKIEWLNTQLPFAIKKIALTNHASGGYSWLRWEESRSVENLGLKDPHAKALAITEGKLSGELFDKAVKQSGREFYEPLLADTNTALAAVSRLIEQVDVQFGADAPSLNDLRKVIESCATLAERLFAEATGKLPHDTPIKKPTISNTSDHRKMQMEKETSPIISVGALQNRRDAIQALRDVAHYFRVNEPQSPVALLAERAARWAEMSMDEWLAAVVKDTGTLEQLRELLDVKTND